MIARTQQHGDAAQTTHPRSDQGVTLEALPRDEAEGGFQAWVDSVRWQFARTYAKKAPHEYTISAWRPELEARFKQCVVFIRKHGQVDRYHGRPFTVYYLNGWKYWTMGSPLEATALINRTCEDWCARFQLDWQPPACFAPMSPTRREACRRILQAYDAICQTPAAKV